MISEKYISVHSLPIHVLLTDYREKAIVFVHGNSCNANFWDDQLNDEALYKKYQLIAFDLPGHGKSGKHTSYQLQEIAFVIPELIKQVQLNDYILTGLSFGTCLVGEAAPRLKDCKGFFMASPNITSDTYPPSSYIRPFLEAFAMASPVVTDEVLTKFARQFVLDVDSLLITKYKKSYLDTDPSFRASLGKAIAERAWTNEIENLLSLNLPNCFVFGKEEKMLQTNYLDNYPSKWNDEIHKIAGAAHLINNEQPQAFNQLLMRFANDVFK